MNAATTTVATATKTFFNQFVLMHAQLVEENKTIGYDARWANGTGYLDGAVRVVHLDEGALVATKDDLGRRIILVGTPAGNVVIFERYRHTGDAPEVLVANQPLAIRSLLPGAGTAWTKQTWEACFPGLNEIILQDNLVDDAGWQNIGVQVGTIGRAIQARSNWTNNPNKKTKE